MQRAGKAFVHLLVPLALFLTVSVLAAAAVTDARGPRAIGSARPSIALSAVAHQSRLVAAGTYAPAVTQPIDC
jgi:hypothetical protein